MLDAMTDCDCYLYRSGLLCHVGLHISHTACKAIGLTLALCSATILNGISNTDKLAAFCAAWPGMITLYAISRCCQQPRVIAKVGSNVAPYANTRGVPKSEKSTSASTMAHWTSTLAVKRGHSIPLCERGATMSRDAIPRRRQ